MTKLNITIKPELKKALKKYCGDKRDSCSRTISELLIIDLIRRGYYPPENEDDYNTFKDKSVKSQEKESKKELRK